MMSSSRAGRLVPPSRSASVEQIPPQTVRPRWPEVEEGADEDEEDEGWGGRGGGAGAWGRGVRGNGGRAHRGSYEQAREVGEARTVANRR